MDFFLRRVGKQKTMKAYTSYAIAWVYGTAAPAALVGLVIVSALAWLNRISMRTAMILGAACVAASLFPALLEWAIGSGPWRPDMIMDNLESAYHHKGKQEKMAPPPAPVSTQQRTVDSDYAIRGPPPMAPPEEEWLDAFG